MASVVHRPKGHKWIQFDNLDGKRPTVRLGIVPEKFAQDFKHNLEDLLVAKSLGQRLPRRTQLWLDELSQKHRKRLTTLGLVSSAPVVTLGILLADFFRTLSVKDSTKRNIKNATDNLTTFFGEDCSIHTVTRSQAKKYRAWLALKGHSSGGGLARATVSRRIRRAAEVFKHALEEGWIEENPFKGLARRNETNRSRDFWVKRSMIKKILAQITDPELKAIVLLARYAGLRCPSEIVGLTWGDINWEHMTLYVASPKTEAHEGQEGRVVPLFAELQQGLLELQEEAPVGEPLLFPRHQIKGYALTKQLRRATKAAGLALWKRPWQNMRATRESELLEKYPLHTVTAWLGHSPNVAISHYAQIAKDHHARAIGGKKRSKKRSTESLS